MRTQRLSLLLSERMQDGGWYDDVSCIRLSEGCCFVRAGTVAINLLCPDLW